MLHRKKDPAVRLAEWVEEQTKKYEDLFREKIPSEKDKRFDELVDCIEMLSYLYKRKR